MNWLYTIIGIVGTILFGWLFGWLYYIKAKKKEITYYLHSFIKLSQKSISDVKGLEIRYKDDVIKDNLILIRGIIQNSGSNDISRQDIQKFWLTLPPHYHWKSFTIINNMQSEVQSSWFIEDNVVKIEWVLLQKGEFLVFDAIIEQDTKNQQWYDDLDFISFDGRINQLCLKKNMLRNSTQKTRKKPYFLFLIYFVVFLVISIWGCFQLENRQEKILSILAHQNNISSTVTIDFIQNEDISSLFSFSRTAIVPRIIFTQDRTDNTDMSYTDSILVDNYDILNGLTIDSVGVRQIKINRKSDSINFLFLIFVAIISFIGIIGLCYILFEKKRNQKLLSLFMNDCNIPSAKEESNCTLP